ncbi:MAG: molybdenum cofactor guanylyltransferase [Bacteroidetes bacterium]|nr:molybdenum cofactor guanylyltransferase [Bacteroidota bacterium]MBS1541257.1 molybdenum cofactor guanylyltransferase [Bacteroidota bacterium]
MISYKHDIDIFITAGGKSSRMGRDKGMMMILGKPMLYYLTDMLAEDNYPFTVIANSDEYKNSNFKVVPDIICEKGPMGALHTAFHYTKKDFVLLLGCDSPFFPAKAVNRLLANAKRKSVAVAQVGATIQPLHAVYPVSIQDKVADHIAENKLKMQKLILQSTHHFVNMDDLVQEFPASLTNINEPKDIAEIESQQKE